MFSAGQKLSSMPNSEMLGVVEDMSRRLLTEEEVAAVMKACRRVRPFALSWSFFHISALNVGDD